MMMMIVVRRFGGGYMSVVRWRRVEDDLLRSWSGLHRIVLMNQRKK